MDFRKELIKDLEELIEKSNLSWLRGKVTIEHPTDPNHGDYSANIALRAHQAPQIESFGDAYRTPQKIADRLISGWKKPDYIDKFEIKNGFINFWLSEAVLGKELEQALKDGERYSEQKRGTSSAYGEGDSQAGEKIIVEFAHPNTHKLFHIGHLRTITLGESISRFLESQKGKVTRANYQGDIGLHIAKALWGIKEKIKNEKLKMKNIKTKTLRERISFLASAYVEGNKGYEGDEGRKKEIEEINKKLYEGDKELVKLWEETRAWSLEYFDRIYKRVGTRFDRLYFESEVAEPGKKLVLDNLGGVFKKDQGAIIFPGEDYGLHNRVFINSRGLPTYEAKDIGLAEFQLKEFSPDKIIHVVGPEQKGYFEVVFKAIEMVFPELKEKEYHLTEGWVRLKEGKMSSRKGEVVEGEWLLDEAKRRLQAKYEMPEDVAEKVAIGAVKYSILRLHPLSEIAFDIDESIRLDGDSGPYLQYTFARTRSVLEKSRSSDIRSQFSDDQISDSEIWQSVNRYLKSGNLSPEELAILRHFYKFPEVVQEAAENYAPNLVCNFLFELAQKYNTFYNKHRILESGISNLESRENAKIPNSRGLAKRSGAGKFQIQSFRLALTQVTGNILKTGLKLLGIHAPERM